MPITWLARAVRAAFESGTGIGLIVLALLPMCFTLFVLATFDDPRCTNERPEPQTSCQTGDNEFTDYAEAQDDARARSTVLGSVSGAITVGLFGVGGIMIHREQKQVRQGLRDGTIPTWTPTSPMSTDYAAQVASAASAQRAQAHTAPPGPPPHHDA